MFNVPTDHPRYHSLMARHLLENGVERGITNLTGLIAHGRGEAFDYLLGERSHEFARGAARAAAAMMLLAKKAVISVNGNTTMLVPKEMIELSRLSGAPLEINLFHDTGNRRQLIARHFRELGIEVLGEKPDAEIPGLTSHRARVDSRGIFDADLVIVSLEDGDRTEALVKGGKAVVAIDLNPMSRTPQTASVAIIDNVTRAFPLLSASYEELRKLSREEIVQAAGNYDHREILTAAERAIRVGAV